VFGKGGEYWRRDVANIAFVSLDKFEVGDEFESWQYDLCFASHYSNKYEYHKT
jgi:hypothetical protein